MNTSGLSRRRVAATTDSSDQSPSYSLNQPSSDSSPTSPTAARFGSGATHAGTALQGGNKIAFDPRDLESDSDVGKMPRLTIMEEVLLLGLKDKQVCSFIFSIGSLSDSRMTDLSSAASDLFCG